jgi:putative flippase GtrA
MTEANGRRGLIDWARLLLSSQLVRFVFVGGVAFLVDAGIVFAALGLGADRLTARVISLAVVVTFTWILNRTLTFGAGKPPSWREYRQYVVASLLGLAINYGVYFAATLLSVALIVAIALGTASGAAFNFFRYRTILRSS